MAKKKINEDSTENSQPIEKIIKVGKNRYVKVPITEPQLFREIGERVAKKELKWAYFAVEHNIGIHHYLIL